MSQLVLRAAEDRRTAEIAEQLLRTEARVSASLVAPGSSDSPGYLRSIHELVENVDSVGVYDRSRRPLIWRADSNAFPRGDSKRTPAI